jgi:hypothetical protein
MADSTMRAQDSISGKLGSARIKLNATLDRNTNKLVKDSAPHYYKFAQLTKLEAKWNLNKTDVPIMGQLNTGHKTTGGNGTGTADFHFNTSMFIAIVDFLNTSGEELRFDTIVENDDKSSAAGVQRTILKDCLLDNVTIAKLDTSTDVLTDSISFTYDDFTVDEVYKSIGTDVL